MRTTSKLLTISLCATALLCSLARVQAAETVDKQLEVDTNPVVQIEVQRGEVTLQSWDKNIIDIKGTLDELSEGLIFERRGTVIRIEDKMPRQYGGRNNPGSRLTITVPRSLSLDAESVSADYVAAQLTGEIRLSSFSGSLQVNDLNGSSKLKTVSGEIRSQGLQGTTALESVSGSITDTDSQGEIHYRLVSGDLQADTAATKVDIEQVSGNLQAKLVRATSLSLQSVSGDSKLTLGANMHNISAESVSGDVTLLFDGLPNASFNLNGGPGGKITNRLTGDKPLKEKHFPSTSLKFQTQQGAGRVEMSTVSGNLTLETL
jgi:DUF4097 and DUF4098 domain-containing protein YvlB